MRGAPLDDRLDLPLADLCVDFGIAIDLTKRLALQELQQAPIPALFLTISERAHLFICDPAVRSFLTGPDGEEKPAESEREAVRQALATSLTADWPPYIQDMIDTGRLRQTG
jgi:hypothetical protein